MNDELEEDKEGVAGNPPASLANPWGAKGGTEVATDGNKRGPVGKLNDAAGNVTVDEDEEVYELMVPIEPSIPGTG